jgi:hypothetical protein
MTRRNRYKSNLKGGTGWGVPSTGAKPAEGQSPQVNPFQIPRSSGYSTTSQVFPNNYFRSWDLLRWRQACDNAFRFGNAIDYAALVSWTYESSGFVRFLFRKVEAAIGKAPFLVVDDKGEELPLWTEELCSKNWQKELRQQIALSHYWGFTALNFNPIDGKVYKYPMQNVDPVNEYLKTQTFDYYDGVAISTQDDLLFIQPHKSPENFLGWMQTISREFILWNNAYNYWLAGAKRNGYPLLAFGYPQQGTADDTNGVEFNPLRNQAEDLAANIDPTKGVVRPYVLNDKGEPVYQIDIDAVDTGSKSDQYKVFDEFIKAKQCELERMIILSTLTSGTGKNGNKSLGEVHERSWEDVAADILEYVTSYMNSIYLPKLRKWYTNMPKNIKFKYDSSKRFNLEDIKILSDIMTENDKALTKEFFVANGIPANYFEDKVGDKIVNDGIR